MARHSFPHPPLSAVPETTGLIGLFFFILALFGVIVWGNFFSSYTIALLVVLVVSLPMFFYEIVRTGGWKKISFLLSLRPQKRSLREAEKSVARKEVSVYMKTSSRGEYIRGIAIKVFFIPLMFSFLVANVEHVKNAFSSTTPSILGIYFLLFGLIYILDVTFGLIGYIYSFRIADAHIRSTQRTIRGWAYCLICYPPFYTLFAVLMNFHNSVTWETWLSGAGIFAIMWAALVLFANGMYVWATIIFGIRFSNLTNRGIITNGPYRYFKHPAYVFKNIGWWLLYVPFVTVFSYGVSWFVFIQFSVAAYVYYMRAKTEEEHLREDTAYRAYEEWIHEYGFWGQTKRAVKKLIQPVKLSSK